MNAMKEHAEKCLVTNFIAHIGAYMAPLRKAGALHIRPTTKPRNIALAGCSRFRMRRIRPIDCRADQPVGAATAGVQITMRGSPWPNESSFPRPGGRLKNLEVP